MAACEHLGAVEHRHEESAFKGRATKPETLAAWVTTGAQQPDGVEHSFPVSAVVAGPVVEPNLVARTMDADIPQALAIPCQVPAEGPASREQFVTHPAPYVYAAQVRDSRLCSPTPVPSAASTAQDLTSILSKSFENSAVAPVDDLT